MNRGEAQRAIDEAFADGLKKLYGVLVQGLTSDAGTINHSEAVKRFAAGVAVNDEAHARASETVEKIFPE